MSDEGENEEPNSIVLSIERVKRWIAWCKRKISSRAKNTPGENELLDKDGNAKTHLSKLNLEDQDGIEADDEEQQRLTGENNPVIQQSSFVMSEATPTTDG